MSKWDNLPNAKHIDRVIASVKAHPQEWEFADAQQGGLGHRYRAMECAASRIMSVWQGGTIVSAVGRDIGWGTEWLVIRRAVFALIAYDDCAYMLDSDPGELAILVAFGDSRAVLLQTACIVFNKEKELV